MKRFPISLLLFAVVASHAQTDPEFSKGLSLQAHWTSGISTSFRSATEDYSGMLILNLQLTVFKGVLRAGAMAGLSYAGQKTGWLAGPQFSVRLFTLGAGPLGTAANLQLNIYYLFHAGRPARAGGSLLLETGKRFFTGPWVSAASREKNWWFHWGLGWRLGRNNIQKEPFNR